MKRRFKPCLCGWHCPEQVSYPVDYTKSWLSTFFNIGNVGSDLICNTTKTETLKLYLTEQHGEVNSGHGCGSNTVWSDYNHPANPNTLPKGYRYLTDLTYDSITDKWEGVITSPPGEADYSYDWVFQTVGGCFRTFVRNTGGTALTPYFDLSNPSNRTSTTGMTIEAVVLNSDCSFSGLLSGYQSVLPKFLFTTPTAYSVDLGSGFTTPANSYSGVYVITPGILVSTAMPSPDPCLPHPTPKTHWWQNLSLNNCPCPAVNYGRPNYYYIVSGGGHCSPTGELLYLGFEAGYLSAVFSNPPNVVLAYYSIPGYLDRFGTNTLTRTLTVGGFPVPALPAGWTAPTTITVNFEGFA